MEFFKRLFGAPRRLGLDDIELPAEGWEFWGEDAQSRSWWGPERVAVRLIRVDGPTPVPWSADAAKAFYDKESGQMGGATLEVEEVETEAGRGLRSVHKYRWPHNPLAIVYVGVILLAWEDAHFRIHTEAWEQGTTGAREAAVMLIMGDEWPRAEETEPVVVKDMDELFQRMGSSALQALPSDDPSWDSLLEDHPLSKVRRQQRAILAALRAPGAERPCGSRPA